MTHYDTHRFFLFRQLLSAFVVLSCVWFTVPTSHVAAISSSNFQIDEDFIGGGGTIDSSSPNYKAQDSIGATAAGDGRSTNYRAQSGATTTNDPMLEFSVSTSSVSLGSLLTSQTATGTASFSVRNYTSNGYIVQLVGNTPTSGSHSLAAMSTTSASSAGTEQFGVNVVANTAPATFGANPQQVPDSSFSSGAAASGYNVANNFKYVSGDVIAQATETSGQTTYTISYIANISFSTPGGQYTATQSLVCTGTY